MSKRKRVNDMKYHYTYRITNIKERMYYYGVHSCDCLPKEDIGVKYWSTSKRDGFVEHQKQNPEQYKYKVIKIFETRIEAVKHEMFLHKKFNVKLHEKFYNDANQTSTGFDTTGKKYSDERREQLQQWMLTNNPFRGKHHTEEVKKYLSDLFKSMSGKCQHCGKEGQYHLIEQWHNDNCAEHPDISIRNKNIEYMKGVSERKTGENNPMFDKHGKDNKKSFKYELYTSDNILIDSCYGTEIKDMLKRNDCPCSFRYMTTPYNYTGNSSIRFKSKQGWYLKTIKDWWGNEK